VCAAVAAVAEHGVEAAPLDELHGVEGHAVVGADAEDGHDVGVVQPRRRLRLALEALQQVRPRRRLGRQHLEGDVAAERFLHRLVDDAHAAAADLAQQQVLAEPPGVGRPGGGRQGRETAARGPARRPQRQRRRHQLAQLAGVLRVLAQAGFQVDAFAGLEARGEPVDQLGQGRVEFVAGRRA